MTNGLREILHLLSLFHMVNRQTTISRLMHTELYYGDDRVKGKLKIEFSVCRHIKCYKILVKVAHKRTSPINKTC